jgi:hypothetical protein
MYKDGLMLLCFVKVFLIFLFGGGWIVLLFVKRLTITIPFHESLLVSYDTSY